VTVTGQRRPPAATGTEPAPPSFTGGRVPVPAGAAKMQAWFIDVNGRRVRTERPVPVDVDDQRTAHRLHHCPRRMPLGGSGGARCEYTEWLVPGAARFCPDHGLALSAPAEKAAV